MIYFELISVQGVRLRSRFCFVYVFFCPWKFNCSSTICLKCYLSSIDLLLPLCQKSFQHICMDLFLSSPFFHWSTLCVLLPIPHDLDYYTFTLLFFYFYSPPMVLHIKYPGWRSHMLLTKGRKLSQQPGYSLWGLLWSGLSTDWTKVGAMPAKPPLVWNCLLQA